MDLRAEYGIPLNYEIKSFKEDHFFSSIAEKLQLTPKELRAQIKNFVFSQLDNHDAQLRVMYILQRKKIYAIKEYVYIEYTPKECELMKIDPQLGQPDVEGQFICEIFKLQIHCVELNDNNQGRHQLIKHDIVTEIEENEVDYTNKNLIHIIKSKREIYQIAIQIKSQVQSPIVYEKKLQMRPRTMYWGNMYEEGILAHIAIQCTLNQEVQNFELFYDVREMGCFDDIVLKIKYGNEKDDEMYFFQLKHKSYGKNVSISNIFEKQHGIFYISKYQKSFHDICELYTNDSTLEIFENIKRENMKFILFSNITCNDDNIETKSYLLNKDPSPSPVLETINTKKVAPYRIKMQNQTSQSNDRSDDFFSLCWVYFNQVNATEITKLLEKDLEYSIHPDKVKLILNWFVNWTRQKNVYKISKSQMINMILETSLPHYDVIIPVNETLKNHDLILKTLNDYSFFPFINASNLETIKCSIIQEIESYFGIEVNTDIWFMEIKNNIIQRNSEIQELLIKRKMLTRSIRYIDLYYALWQIRKLPMLVKFNTESTKSIEFILKNFKRYLKTKSFVFIYEKEPPNIDNSYGLNQIIHRDEIFTCFQQKIPEIIENVVKKDANFLRTVTPKQLLNLLTMKNTIGTITYFPNELLGEGCMGTSVFRGEFDKRTVAVKRLLNEKFTLSYIEREVKILRESEDHPHVVGYYYIENDDTFSYIALELCQGNLEQHIKERCISGKIENLVILHQVTSGIAHLHKIGIVHRDIKPRNVLLSMENQGEIKVMISDFGVSKKLPEYLTCFYNSTGQKGTHGWIAPEMLNKTSEQTRAVDLFSLGCLFYYVLSEGSHPFGEEIRRQTSIIDGNYDLSNIKGSKWEKNVQIPLITALISNKPEMRPECEVVLSHPTFWSSADILDFFQEVSDYLVTPNKDDRVVLELESYRKSVVRTDWLQHIDVKVLGRRTNYKGNSVKDLLRVIRNAKHHYGERSIEVQNILGEMIDGFTEYWTSRFPLLLIHTWITIQELSNEKIFSKYYHKTYKYSTELLIHLEEYHKNE